MTVIGYIPADCFTATIAPTSPLKPRIMKHKKIKSDIRFKCANYDFSSGHCKAYRMVLDVDYYTDENGEVKPISIPGEPCGCSGDPECEKFTPKTDKK